MIFYRFSIKISITELGNWMKYFSHIIAALILVLNLGYAHADSHACPTEPITVAYDCQLKLANEGTPSAQEWLGDYYFTGMHTKTDYPKAEKWYLKAGENGIVRAQIRLGFMYAENHFPGVENNLEKGEYWFKQAADQDVAEGLFRMGNFYHHYIKPPNYEKTIYWLEKAAEKNYGAAQYDLARIYNSDKIPEKKPELALKHMENAAENGIRQAQMALVKHYEDQGNNLKALQWAQKIASSKGTPLYWKDKVKDLKKKVILSPSKDQPE